MIALADVAIVVSDARASARWWERVLGFASHTIGGTGHAILVGPPGERLVLHLCEGFAPLDPGDTGIAFITDDLPTLVRRMAKHRVRFPTPPKKESWGSMAKFEDPDGNIFWLLEVPTAMVRATLKLRAAPRSSPRVRRSTPRRARRKI
jgi:catechol 2,3-dioxygenase-like lactoylglutathione lyase family enzyme